MTGKQEWQERVGRKWAESWHLTDRSFAGLTEQLLHVIAALPGSSIADIGCGAGELSLALSRQRLDAQIIGVDVSPDLVEAAVARAAGNPSTRFLLADASTWQPQGFAPDLYVSRHGVMFFDDPVAAFTHLRGISAPDARLAFSCFRSREENLWMTGLAALLPGVPAPADLRAPGPFAFADPDYVSDILTRAGWSGLRIERCDFAYVAGTGDDAEAQAADLFCRIGPLAPVIRDLSGEARELLGARLAAWIARNAQDQIVAFPAAAWIVTARRD
jgi:SAM-dependent methyltransferase